ncbi:cytidylyltransferase domain-containing protein [Thalassospira australica]|uniref:acylneuraminate cytidylyltransferase family protein n=1 Tax=Thalassospira australica TaxID=1528106 RepID=UPI00051A769E|nr:acylneuraminate cytidylyltransferase family protein [Thalassospira australica]
MLNNQRIVSLTPARGGSKSVPYKNLFSLGDKPLLAWPLEAAFATPEIDDVYVSTDDDKIASVAKDLGARVHLRPDELSTDTALVIDAVRHFFEMKVAEFEPPDIIVLLEATSPFRSAGLISKCLKRMFDEDLDSIATFNEASINPERCWKLDGRGVRPFIDGAIPWKPRQQLSPAYQLNGAVYAFRPNRLPPEGPSILFGKMGAEVISADSVIDIDDRKDFVIADALLQSQRSNEPS